MIFGIVTNYTKDKDYAFSLSAVDEISRRGGQALVDQSYADTPLGNDSRVRIGCYSECDILFSIGGDGTFLSAVHDHYAKDVPIIGVNLGSIGFLAEISPDSFTDALDRLFHGQYVIEKRIQLDVCVKDANGRTKGKALCLNDAVVARGFQLRVLTLDLLIDGDYVERLSGDGVIISTPTGSTAYSLAAGGPIIKPELDIFMVTPICPHTLHNRSYIVSTDSEVRLHLTPDVHEPILSLDGRNEISIAPDDVVVIRKSQHMMKFAKIGYANFYQTIRRKLRARGSMYEDHEK